MTLNVGKIWARDHESVVTRAPTAAAAPPLPNSAADRAALATAHQWHVPPLPHHTPHTHTV